jgi:hypothetical protein
MRNSPCTEMTKLFSAGRVSSVTSRLGTGKWQTIFYSVSINFREVSEAGEWCFSKVYYAKILTKPDRDDVFGYNYCIQIAETSFAEGFF